MVRGMVRKQGINLIYKPETVYKFELHECQRHLKVNKFN